MKFTIELPEIINNPILRIAKGFKISPERVIQIMVGDYVGAMDANFTLHGKPVTPHCKAFDLQFNDQTPQGFTTASSYEMSRANWAMSMPGDYDVVAKTWRQSPP